MEDSGHHRAVRLCSCGRAPGRPVKTLGDKWQDRRSGQSVCVWSGAAAGGGARLPLRPARALGQAHVPPSTPNTLGPAGRVVRVSG